MLEVEDLIAGQDETAVHLEARDGAGDGPGRSRTAGARSSLTVPSAASARTPPRLQGAGPGDGGDFALAQEALKALVLLVDHPAFARLGGREVDAPPLHADPVSGPLHRPVDRRRFQELLGRDAAPVQAGTPTLLFSTRAMRRPCGRRKARPHSRPAHPR